MKPIRYILALCLAAALLTSCGIAAPDKTSAESAQSLATEASASSTTAPAVFAPTRGRWREDTFTNTGASLSFTVPNSWTKAADKDFVSAFLDEQTAAAFPTWTDEQLASAAMYPDAFASDPMMGTTVYVVYLNTADIENGDTLDENGYLDLVHRQLQAEDSSYKFDEVQSVQLNSLPYKALSAHVASGSTLLRETVCCRRSGNWFIQVTFISTDNVDLNELYAMFA